MEISKQEREVGGFLSAYLRGALYEIFTGLQDDEEGIVLPKSVNTGWIVKNLNSDGSSRYDFSFQNRRGYKTTVEGLSARFNKEYWNYAQTHFGSAAPRYAGGECHSTH